MSSSLGNARAGTGAVFSPGFEVEEGVEAAGLVDGVVPGADGGVAGVVLSCVRAEAAAESAGAEGAGVALIARGRLA
ncbi:MAG: hypothetical protein SFV15_12420 [Polyangiaceae bacterium]|nr:hypothetical protein [Polyangiaceae bacterium]